MSPPFATPNVDNYYIGKGQIYFKVHGDADSAYVHAGNVPKFEFTPKPEIKKHYSHMAGTKTLDKVAIISKEAEVSITIEELDGDNLIMALLGELQSDGSYELLKAVEVVRTVKFVGNNDFGPKIELILHKVFFETNKALDLIGDDWGKAELMGQVLRDGDVSTGSFGNWKFV